MLLSIIHINLNLNLPGTLSNFEGVRPQKAQRIHFKRFPIQDPPAASHVEKKLLAFEALGLLAASATDAFHCLPLFDGEQMNFKILVPRNGWLLQ